MRAVLPHLRAQGIKAGLVSVKLLQPFPEAEVVAALAGKKAVMVLERSDQTALTALVTAALFRARENAVEPRHEGIPALADTPRLTTAIFGLGGHDLQPRHLIAAFKELAAGSLPPLIYLGSQFFEDHPSEHGAEVQARMRAAYPETELMALRTEPNPVLLPPGAMRIRFHSVGGYGTIATGKLLTDILAGLLGMHSKSAPKYGSEKSGAPTNYYITLSPEPIWLTNAELEDVEVVIAPDHKAFIHTNPLKGLVHGGTFMLQTSLSPEEVWRELPRHARKAIREREIRFFTIDAFTVARKHAPTPDLETRMMGIAFIGAVAAHVDRVAAGAPREDILERVRHQLEKKFGRKGANVVESNMAVIVDGIEATVRVDYDAPELVAIGEEHARESLLTVAMSAAMCPSTTAEHTSGLFDPAYYEDLMMRPFREGTIAEAPVLPGVGLFMPPGTGAAKDKGLFRREVPEFNPTLCTGCMDCALVCPDAAIPNTVHEVHDLLLTAVGRIEATPGQKDGLRMAVYGIAERTREALRHKDERAFSDIVASASSSLREDPVMAHVVDRLVAELATYPVARTRPFFDSMEKEQPGTGGLFAATVDPWKCTGCLECIDVCGPGALTVQEQDADVLAALQQRFGFMGATPNTPTRFTEGSDTADGDIKRLMLDHDNFYATTGGHGGCRGCGEVTAIRLVMSTSHAISERHRREHLKALTGMVDRLYAKRATVADPARQERLTRTLTTLERRLYEQEGGPTGNGPASTIIANSTGCSSVYASTMPFNNYLDPWVNSLFQDAQPLAKGIFEGVAAQSVADVRALRVAELELSDSYEPEVHDKALSTLSWEGYSPQEMELLPTVLTIGGDGATYDIGFGAMSRILASDTPVKVLVLNSGVYSNTGGQASTASLTGQDSDLARFGSAHDGKHESRKELGLLASFHPNVYVCSTSTAIQGHFLTSTMEFLRYQDAAAVLDVYTPCGSEHGIPEEASSRRARLAVESRMNPVFVHDPRRGSTLHDWFSLDGNPDIAKTWTNTDLAYRDDAGELQLMTLPLTPAEFALGETRFRKQFKRLPAELDDVAVRIDEYVELSRDEQAARVPFVFATDENQKLIKVQCSDSIVALVKDRRRYWQILQYLSGAHEAKLTALHQSDLADLRSRYEEAMRERESSIDSIAEAMSSLASTSRAPVGPVGSAPPAAPAGPGCRPRRPAAPSPGARGHRGRGRLRTAGRPGAPRRGRHPEVQRLRHLLPGAAAALRAALDGHRRSGAEGRPDDPRCARDGRADARAAQADRPGEEDLRRGDHPVSTDSLVDEQVELLRRRLEADPQAFRETFIEDGMNAVTWEFSQQELGEDFTRALWDVLLREDDASRVLMRFLWGGAAQPQAQVHPRDRRPPLRPVPDVRRAVRGLARRELDPAAHPRARGAREGLRPGQRGLPRLPQRRATPVARSTCSCGSRRCATSSARRSTARWASWSRGGPSPRAAARSRSTSRRCSSSSAPGSSTRRSSSSSRATRSPTSPAGSARRSCSARACASSPRCRSRSASSSGSSPSGRSWSTRTASPAGSRRPSTRGRPPPSRRSRSSGPAPRGSSTRTSLPQRASR